MEDRDLVCDERSEESEEEGVSGGGAEVVERLRGASGKDWKGEMVGRGFG